MVKKYTAIYTRISKRGLPNSDGSSLRSQEHRCRERLRSLGVPEEEVLHFSDDGYSAGNLERPQFQELLSLIEGGRVRRIVMTEISRFTRNNFDYVSLRQLLDQHKVSLELLSTDVDLNSLTGNLMLNLQAVLGEFERAQNIERSKNAARSRSKRGLWNGTIPLGYISGERPGELVIHEEEAELVRLIYTLYYELGSVTAVLKHLSERHLNRPPRRQKSGELSPPRPFADSSLRRILTARCYVGELELKPHNKALDQSLLSENDRYELIRGRWEPIVDEQLWRSVQERYTFNKTRKQSTANQKHKRFILAGVLVCGECGELFNTDSAKGNSFFYYCHPSSKATCSKPRWSAETLEVLILQDLLKLYLESGALERAILELRRQEREELDETPQRVKRLEERIKAKKQLKGQLFASLEHLQPEAIHIVGERLVECERELLAQTEELDALRQKLQAPTHDAHDIQRVFDSLIAQPEALLHIDLFYMRQLLMHTLDRVEVFGDREYRLYLTQNPIFQSGQVRPLGSSAAS